MSEIHNSDKVKNLVEFLSTTIPVTEQVWDENVLPLVSISCITYNHENFICDAIEGFLVQKTTFPIEILIHDDASTDGTANIIREYQKKFPDTIKPIIQKENQYSKGEKINATYQFPRAKGKYIALCEGDDYWIDPLKLQKQVDFLEANLDYGLVHTKAKVYNQTKKTFFKNVLGDENNTYFDFLIKNRIITATVLFRKDYLLQSLEEIEPSTQNWKMGDYPMWLWFAHNSKVKFLPDCTTVRRLVSGSTSNQKSKERQIAFFSSHVEIREFFIQKYGCSDSDLKEIKKNVANSKVKKGVLLGSYEFYKEGINEKKEQKLGINIMERIYGILLRWNISKYLLSLLLAFRRKAI